jgi:hypothetical protein
MPQPTMLPHSPITDQYKQKIEQFILIYSTPVILKQDSISFVWEFPLATLNLRIICAHCETNHRNKLTIAEIKRCTNEFYLLGYNVVYSGEKQPEEHTASIFRVDE